MLRDCLEKPCPEWGFSAFQSLRSSLVVSLPYAGESTSVNAEGHPWVQGDRQGPCRLAPWPAWICLSPKL